jgi:poly-beta-1,6-N-acetyl-D-glucosamine synthase
MFMIEMFLGASVFITMIYIAMVIWFIMGWIKGRRCPVSESNIFPRVSILIAARNEAKTISMLLNSLREQDYPVYLFEVIIVNDFSEDDTSRVVNRFIKDNDLKNFHMIESPDRRKSGKKSALEYALKKTKGEIILTTDADCVMGKRWLLSMVKHFIDDKSQMVIGPVDIDTNGYLFNKLQSLEFMSLTGSTAGSAAWGTPVMCNGANLAFRKDSRVKLQEKISGKWYVSGDDVFLMEAFQKEFPGKILFNKEPDAIVLTAPAPDLATFFNQRVRWASKAGGFNHPAMISTGVIVALFNLILSIATLLAMIFNVLPVKLLLIMWMSKCIIDFPLLLMVSRFKGKTELLWYYLPLQAIYPFYVFIVIISSLSGVYRWKGRKVQ